MTVAVLSSLLLVSFASVNADAASIRLRCDARSGNSKIDADGRDVRPGTYTAAVMSGGNSATATQASIGDSVEFDFSSKANDIAVGATPILRTFIQGNPKSVTATITGPAPSGAGIASPQTVTCRTR